jgi:hypothetical protein
MSGPASAFGPLETVLRGEPAVSSQKTPPGQASAVAVSQLMPFTVLARTA